MKKLNSIIYKIEPFFEHVGIGLLFIKTGIYILDELHTNFFAITGLISIFWGGFQIFIGIIIYVVVIIAYIFKPESFIHIKRKRIVESVLKRVEKDLESGNIQKAQDRLHGLISKYPNYLKIKFELAGIYLLDKDFVNAGRYLFLKPALNKQERFCVENFKNSLGNNPFQILKKISSPSQIDREFVQSSKSKIAELVNNIKVESEKKSWIVKNYSYYLHELNAPFYQRFFHNHKDVIIQIIILITLICLTEFLKK